MDEKVKKVKGLILLQTERFGQETVHHLQELLGWKTACHVSHFLKPRTVVEGKSQIPVNSYTNSRALFNYV